MKRTSAPSLITSPERLNGLSKIAGARLLFRGGALLFCCGLMFFLGRNSAGIPDGLSGEIQALRVDVQQQQGKVDALRRDNEQSVSALAARLAELQAASTRLDALGERLANMGQLTLEEFDFSERAPIGGPGDFELKQSLHEDDLSYSIALLGDRLHRQSSQLDALQFLMVNRQLENDLTPTGWPVRKGWISSRFGERNDPFTGKREHHGGLDFAGTKGSDVLSVASGVVIWASNRTGYGKTVEIDHGNGYTTRYAHSDKVVVKAGDHVNAGQKIALLGSTGRASAPHVHFEVLKDGTRINPARFVGQLR